MIIKVKPDKKRAESIIEMAVNREKLISQLDFNLFSTLIAENFYEIIKELSSALILLDGFKSVGENSHKDLIDLLLNYNDFSEGEIVFLHDLRIKRHKSSYEGKIIDHSYLKEKKDKIEGIIKKLRFIINNKIQR